MEQSGNNAATAGGIIFGVVFFLGLYLVVGYLVGRVLRKAGDPLWHGFVPVLSSWRIFQLGGYAGWWSLLAFVPGVNIVAVVFAVIAQYRIGLGFGKDGAFVLLAIFVPVVWYAWIGFDSSRWEPARAVPATARY